MTTCPDCGAAMEVGGHDELTCLRARVKELEWERDKAASEAATCQAIILEMISVCLKTNMLKAAEMLQKVFERHSAIGSEFMDKFHAAERDRDAARAEAAGLREAAETLLGIFPLRLKHLQSCTYNMNECDGDFCTCYVGAHRKAFNSLKNKIMDTPLAAAFLAERDAMSKALAFYADAKNYIWRKGLVDRGVSSPVNMDKGQTARAAMGKDGVA